jgi:hypothetical protein
MAFRDEIGDLMASMSQEGKWLAATSKELESLGEKGHLDKHSALDIIQWAIDNLNEAKARIKNMK